MWEFGQFEVIHGSVHGWCILLFIIAIDLNVFESVRPQTHSNASLTQLGNLTEQLALWKQPYLQ
jgi:hypothetical protein